MFSYPYGAMNLIPALAIRFRIANSCTGCCGIFERLLQDEEGQNSKNLSLSLFSEDLPNGPNFSAGSISPLDGTLIQ
jgi:hypothetical protein